MQKFPCGSFRAMPTLSFPLSGPVNGWRRCAKREVPRSTPKCRASDTASGRRRSQIQTPRLGFCRSGVRSEYRLAFFLNCELYRARDFAMQFDRNLIFADYFDGISKDDFALFDLVALERECVGDVACCHRTE